MKALLEKIYFILLFGEITTSLPRIVGPGERDPAAGHTSSPILLFFNALVVLGTLLYALPLLPRMWRALLQMKWAFALYLWMSLSILWSVDRDASFRAGTYALIYLLSAIYMAFRYRPDDLLQKLSHCFLGVALLSIPGEFLLPALDDPAPGWSGVFAQKNVLGLCMMIGIAVILVQGKRWTAFRCATVALYAGLLILSQSFTAVVATAVIVLFIFSQRVAAKYKAMLWTFVTGLLCILSIVDNPLELLLSAGGKSTNFTGRDVIWAFALNGIAQRPIVGHGYQAFWADASDVLQYLSWNPHHAHNGFLQVTLDLGVVGLVLTLSLMANTWRRARRVQKYDRSNLALWMLVLTVGAMAHNLMEADLMSLNFFWYLLVLGSFSLLRAENEAQVASSSQTKPASVEADLVTVLGEGGRLAHHPPTAATA